MKRLCLIFIFMILPASCKPKKSSFSEATSSLDGSWFSLCTLGEIEGTLLSYDIKINFKNNSFTSVTTYYTDGGCKDPLHAMNKNGVLSHVQEGEKKLKSLTINQWLFTLYHPDVVTKYNELSVYKKTWKLGESQDITSSRDPSLDQDLWGRILLSEPNNFNFYPQADKTYTDGRLFLRM